MRIAQLRTANVSVSYLGMLSRQVDSSSAWHFVRFVALAVSSNHLADDDWRKKCEMIVN